MSVYLGQEKVGVSYATNTANMYDIDRTIMSDDAYTPWVRPEGWPDLDSLNLEMSGETSFFYMTYRTGHVDDVCAFHINRKSNTSFTIELGTITNGEFIANLSETFTSDRDCYYWLTPNEGYSEGTIVVKIVGRITRFNLINSTRDASLGGGTLVASALPMLERICYIPELISFNSISSGSYVLERDKMNNGTGTALTTLSSAWSNCYNLQDLDISGLKTPNITSLYYTFSCCRKLENLDISHFETSKVTNLTGAFNQCQLLKEIDLSTLNLTNLASFASTFTSCYALKEIKGLEKIVTDKITSLANVFSYCYSLQDLSTISNWNISNVTNLSYVFNGCYAIKKLDLSKWDVSKVTIIDYLFYNCQNLEQINFPLVMTSTLTGVLRCIFGYCYNLLKVELSWIRPITSAVTSISYLFYNCRSLKEINIPEGWDVTGCTASESFFRIFGYCYKLEKITGISNWDASNYNYSINYMFADDYSLKELDIKNWCPHPTTLYSAFNNCCSLESLDLTGWHWENMTGTALYAVFGNCHSLKEIKGIEHMGDSGNITSFYALFSACHSLISLPNIDSWDVSKVTTCLNMFSNCCSLKNLTISNWSLSKCTNISQMFYNCYNLEVLELTNWSLPALTTVPDTIFNNLNHLLKCSGLPIALNHYYRYVYSLPEDQWIRIFNQLPTVSGRTLYITTENINRLSSTTKAIATNKGWTLAN